MNTAILGIPVVCVGFLQMWWHWQQWSDKHSGLTEERERRFYFQQFRRRALIGSLMAVVGSLLTSLQWISDPRTWTISVFALLLLLAGILFLALTDMLYGVMHHQHGRDAAEARKALIREYLRLRKKTAAEKTPEESDSE